MASALARSSKPSSMPEAAGKGLEIGKGLRRDRSDRSRVHAAAEVAAELDIGDQLTRHCLAEQPLQLFAILPIVSQLIRFAKVEVPVTSAVELRLGFAK